MTTTRAAHVKVKTAEDAKRGGPSCFETAGGAKLPPASRKKRAPVSKDEDEWDEEDAVDVRRASPKGGRACGRRRGRARPSWISQ